MRARVALLCVITGSLASCAAATTALADSQTALLDGRQFEQVSPTAKYGSSIKPQTLGGGVIQAAENGSGLAYLTSGPFEENPEANTGPEHQQIIAKREPNGIWATREIMNPHKGISIVPVGEGYEYRAVSSDLSAALAEPYGETLLPPPSKREPQEPTLYLRDNLNNSIAPIVSEANTPPGTIFGETFNSSNRVLFEGSTPDLKHAIFSDPNALTEPSSEPGVHTLYEWSGNPGEPGHIEIASITPKGEGPPVHPGLGYTLLGSRVVRNAVSTDGSRVVFQEAYLYLRDMDKHETLRVDTPEAPFSESDPIFQGANSDGTRIFFIDRRPLVSRADRGHILGEGDLYVFEAARGLGPLSGQLHDLTIGGETHGFVIGYGGEGSGEGLSEPFNVYFVDSGVLSSNKGPGGGGAVEEDKNLYVDHYNGTTWESPRFIATLSPEDRSSWGEAEGGAETNAARLTSRVSGNGRFIAFMSSEPLTGFDNVDAVSGVRDEEVFEFDSVTGKLVCVSCDPSGERPAGVFDPEHEWEHVLLGDEQKTWQNHWLAGSVPGWNAGIREAYSQYQPKYLLDSGRLFFESSAGLVPAAVNGRVDVYEYEPEGLGRGAGACGPAAGGPTVVFRHEKGEAGEPGPGVGGCVGLVSGGASGEESAFLDASGVGPGGEEGEDVFVLTAEQLGASDTDTAYDIYDAHECSAKVPCPPNATTTVSPACNDTDSCRAAPAPQPAIFGAPSSATFNGQGNPASEPAPTAPKPALRTLTRGQELANALKVCKRDRAKRRRASCEAAAKRRYGPPTRPKKKG